MVKVALTREEGNNEKLVKILVSNSKLKLIELPCIAFGTGPDIDKLSQYMTKNDLIIITSPQAASVFIDQWVSIGKPAVKVVSVGKGTSKPLESMGLTPVFEPSDATGETLAEELPTTLGNSVLYPSSSLADNKLTDILTSRGFQVSNTQYISLSFLHSSSYKISVATTCM